MDTERIDHEVRRVEAIRSDLVAAGGPRAKRTAKILGEALDLLRSGAALLNGVPVVDLELPPVAAPPPKTGAKRASPTDSPPVTP